MTSLRLHSLPPAPSRPPRPAGGLLAVLFLALLAIVRPAPSADTTFRIAFARQLFTDVNENDARASMKAWGQSVARERGIPTDPDPQLLETTAETIQAMRERKTDAVALRITDFQQLREQVPCTTLFVTVAAGLSVERYGVIVRSDRGISGLADLRGKTLSLQDHPRACLAPQWLDLLLHDQNLPQATRFFGPILRAPKTSKAILPVFFRQRDAAVATLAGFQVMVELNPQLGQQLKIIATSPEVVPVLLCFRPDYAPPFKDLLFATLRELHRSPTGQQVLHIFQGDRLEEQTLAFLQPTLDLLARYARLHPPVPPALPEPNGVTSP